MYTRFFRSKKKRITSVFFTFLLLLSVFVVRAPEIKAEENGTVEIYCRKIVNGTNAPIVPFEFTLTQVADELGTPMPQPEIAMITETVTGPGDFSFTVNGLTSKSSPYYFKIQEKQNGGKGWIHDTTSYIAKVIVDESLNTTLTYVDIPSVPTTKLPLKFDIETDQSWSSAADMGWSRHTVIFPGNVDVSSLAVLFTTDSTNPDLMGISHYLSAFSRDKQSRFIINPCIEFFVYGHSHDYLLDSLDPQIAWVLLHSPFGNDGFTDLSDMVQWYKDELGLTTADFITKDFLDAIDSYRAGLTIDVSTEEKWLEHITTGDYLGPEGTVTERLTNLGLSDINEFYEVLMVNIALTATLWHYSDGINLIPGGGYLVKNSYEYIDPPLLYSDIKPSDIFATKMPPAVQAIYDYYTVTNDTNIKAASDTPNPNSFILTRSISGGNHVYTLANDTGSTDWSNFDIELTGDATIITGGVSHTSSTVTLSGTNNTFTVVPNNEESSYKLRGGNQFKIGTWFGLEGDGTSGDSHLQDHAIVIYDKEAKATFELEYGAETILKFTNSYREAPTVPDTGVNLATPSLVIPGISILGIGLSLILGTKKKKSDN